MAIDTHAHLIEIYEGGRSLTIYHIRGTEHQLFTSVKLPDVTWDTGRQSIEEFCRKLGENLLFDSPSARKLLGL